MKEDRFMFCRAFVGYFKSFCLIQPPVIVWHVSLLSSWTPAVVSHETKDRNVVMSGPSEDSLTPIVSAEREDLSGQNTLSVWTAVSCRYAESLIVVSFVNRVCVCRTTEKDGLFTWEWGTFSRKFFPFLNFLDGCNFQGRMWKRKCRKSFSSNCDHKPSIRPQTTKTGLKDLRGFVFGKCPK